MRLDKAVTFVTTLTAVRNLMGGLAVTGLSVERAVTVDTALTTDN